MSENEDVLDRIRDCVANVDSDGADKLVREALYDGVSPADIITKAISRGTEIVGKKFEVGEYFLTELVLVGEIVEKALAQQLPETSDGQIWFYFQY
jgi:methanogenic corrinoid protein MtbC1